VVALPGEPILIRHFKVVQIKDVAADTGQ
jgi:hypothetical protein